MFRTNQQTDTHTDTDFYKIDFLNLGKQTEFTRSLFKLQISDFWHQFHFLKKIHKLRSCIEKHFQSCFVIAIYIYYRFPNLSCYVQGGTKNGTCYTAEECLSKGGTNDGSCAEGFGVCCTCNFLQYFSEIGPIAHPVLTPRVGRSINIEFKAQSYSTPMTKMRFLIVF